MSNNKLGCSYITHMVRNGFPSSSSELVKFNYTCFSSSIFEILIQKEFNTRDFVLFFMYFTQSKNHMQNRCTVHIYKLINSM